MKNALRIFTNSERSSSMCPRRWGYRYRDRLSEYDSPAPLRQGTLIHLLLAFWYRFGMAPEQHDLLELVSTPWLEKRHAWVDDNVRDSFRADELRIEDQEIHDESVGMIDHYIQTWGPNDRADWEVLYVEEQIARVMPFFDEHDGIPRWWVYAGGIDLVILEKSTGMRWLVEHKSTVEKDLDGYLRKLHIDPQIRGYVWGLNEPDPSLCMIKEPIPVDGVLYNVLRKKVPRVPPLLKPKSKKEGAKSEGLSKAAIDTTRAVYLGEIERHGFDPDDYAEILGDVERNRFFARERYPLSLADLDDWERDTMAWLRWASPAERLAELPRQTGVCCGIAAQECAYTSICILDGEQARASYTVSTVRHHELHGALADPSPIGKSRPALLTASLDLPDEGQPIAKIRNDAIRSGSLDAEDPAPVPQPPTDSRASDLDDLGPDPFER